MSRQRRAQTPFNQRRPERVGDGAERQRTSPDLPRVPGRVLEQSVFSGDGSAPPAQRGFCWQNPVGARTGESPVAMETTARRDAEMEGDMCRLQRRTNILLEKHKKRPRPRLSSLKSPPTLTRGGLFDLVYFHKTAHATRQLSSALLISEAG